MAASPAAAAILGDLLWCLGIGCALGAVRGLYALLLGRGVLRTFVGDILAFAAAAVLLCGFSASASATGLARWYMAAAIAAGALCWQWAVQRALFHLGEVLLAVLAWPWHWLCRTVLSPLVDRLRAVKKSRKEQRIRKKQKMAQKKQKKQLPNKKKVLYN